MASKYAPETNTMPHLVVKIVGSKQVKYFVEGPHKGAVSNEELAEDPTAVDSVPGEESSHSQRTPVPPSPLSANTVNEDMRIYMELQKMCDRQCVTAPCGDRSLSYIHVKKKSLSAVTDLHKATQRQDQEQEQGPLSPRHQEGELKENGRELEKKEAEEKELLQVIREELMAGGGWGGGDGGAEGSGRGEDGGDADGDGGGEGALLMEKLERDVLELDSSGEGSLHQSQLSYALLRHRLPLTLPTLARLFHAFAKDTSPNEVDYGKLLQFLRAAVKNKQTEVKVNGGSNSGSRTSQSARRPSDLSSAPTNGGPRGRWVDRFQELEEALNLCDTQNTGFLDKDKARRLIQNYNVILDLSLSPVKIAEATRTARATEGKIHLASTLQRLRGL